MADFKILQNPISKKWVISAPRRSKKPEVGKSKEALCPFCVGREQEEPAVYVVSGSENSENSDNQNISKSEYQHNSDTSETQIQSDVSESLSTSEYSDNKTTDWLVRVIPNKYPFTEPHEVIIHSQDHHKNFDELPITQVQLILETYKARFNAHRDKGQVYIFHNAGEGAGESIPHPHSQLTVIPNEVTHDIPALDPNASVGSGPRPSEQNSPGGQIEEQPAVVKEHFYLFCPKTSTWPDEVWIVPKSRGNYFGDATDTEISELAFILNRLIQILSIRHGHEFPYNHYIYPGKDWYMRIMPRVKGIGGFEVGTGIFVNTSKPDETIAFLKEHFEDPDEDKIRKEYSGERVLGV